MPTKFFDSFLNGKVYTTLHLPSTQHVKLYFHVHFVNYVRHKKGPNSTIIPPLLIFLWRTFMSDAKIFAWTILLFILVFIKFTLFSPIWLIYGFCKHIRKYGFSNLDALLRASFAALGKMWRKHVFFWLDEEKKGT